MNFSSHAKAGLIVSGLAAGANFLFFGGAQQTVFAAALCFVGSVFPDLDTDSIPSRWAARAGLAFCCLCLYQKVYLPAVIAGMLFFAVKSGKHREFTHSYGVAALAIIIGVSIGNFFYCAFGVGLLCHFIVDGLSPLDPGNWI